MSRFSATSLIVLLVVLSAVGIAAWQLARTVSAAQSINGEASSIARSGRGINLATDSVVQLRRTNALAESILRSASPLRRQLGAVVGEARGINDVAGAINGNAGRIEVSAGQIQSSAGQINTSAGTINGSAGSIDSTAKGVLTTAGAINKSAGAIGSTAGTINTTAGNISSTASGINTRAAGILVIARRIDQDARLINVFLDQSKPIVGAIKGDSGNILGQAGGAHATAACIDRKLNGRSADDGDCGG